MASSIHRLGFVKNTNGRPVEHVLDADQKMSVTFNKNEVTLGAGKLDIIQIMAYNGRGRRLKKVATPAMKTEN